MKIQCEVCNKDAASVFCMADEAALCASCDRRVHHANKLASKHQRFALHLPSSPKQSPLCDVCKEKRAFLFCQQDRAILCRDCDVPIHSANEHTQKHDRFLLTEVKLSATPALSSNTSNALPLTDFRTKSCDSVPAIPNPSSVVKTPISEYLIEMLPGWHVDDLLCKSDNDGMLQFLEGEIENNTNGYSSLESCGIWMPESPSGLFIPQNYPEMFKGSAN